MNLEDIFSPLTFMIIFTIGMSLYSLYIIIASTIDDRRESAKYVDCKGERCEITQPVWITRSMGLWISGEPKVGGEYAFKHCCRVCGREFFAKERKPLDAVCFACRYDGRYS